MKGVIFASIFAAIVFSGCSYHNNHNGLKVEYHKEYEDIKQHTGQITIKQRAYITDKIGKLRIVKLQITKQDVYTPCFRWYAKYNNGYIRHGYWNCDRNAKYYRNKQPISNQKIKLKNRSTHCDIKLTNNGITDKDGFIEVYVRAKGGFRFAKLKDELYNLDPIIKQKFDSNVSKINLKALKNTGIKITYPVIDKKSIKDIDDNGFEISYKGSRFQQKFSMIDGIDESILVDIVDKSIDNLTHKISNYVYEKYFTNIKIIPANIDSRFPFDNSVISIKYITKYPNIKKLLSKYFKDDKLLNKAVDYFPSISPQKSQGTESTNFILYKKGKYKLSIRNKKYYFFEKNINLKHERNKMTVYMSELGTKHRVKFIYE